jgi:large subunit ribosomal protein L22
MAWKSAHKYARISPRKVRLVIDLIRDLQVPHALDVLTFTRKRAARMVEKVLLTAVANADDQGEVNADDLYVTCARVDEGPTIKRWQPKDRGRAHPIMKRTCHIVVEVDAETGRED